MSLLYSISIDCLNISIKIVNRVNTRNLFSLVRKLKGIRLRIYIYIYNPSPRAECGTRSIFKRSFTGLNSKFSF